MSEERNDRGVGNTSVRTLFKKAVGEKTKTNGLMATVNWARYMCVGLSTDRDFGRVVRITMD